MPKIQSFSKAQEIAQRKFFELFRLKVQNICNDYDAETADKVQKLQAEHDAYLSELEAKPSIEIEKLYLAMQAELAQEAMERDEKVEKERFFNLPAANADFDFWSKAAYWTIEEAVALSLGKDPKQVNWKAISYYSKPRPNPPFQNHPASPLVLEYEKRLELCNRAVAFKQLYTSPVPALFIGWCEQTGLDFPTELKELVIARGGIVGNWKMQCEQFEKLANEAIDECKKHKRIREEEMAAANEIIGELRKNWMTIPKK